MWTISFTICSVVLSLEVVSRFSRGEFLSFGVSQSICKLQQEFLDTGTTVNAVKERPKNQAEEECLWYQRNPNCNPGSNCLTFASKTCKELGQPENQISRSKIIPKIVGGQEVEPPHKYPSYARILSTQILKVTNETAKAFSPSCGSVILSDTWVLTASHCNGIDYEGVDYRHEYKYLAGRHDYTVPEDDEQIVKPVEAQKPPKIDNSTAYYATIDIKLIKVDPPFQFNDQISAAKLPTKSYKIPGQLAVIMGVGATQVEDEEYYDLPDVPMEAEISVIDLDTCRKIYSEGGFDPRNINEFRICFARDGGFVSSCYLDSGGPAFVIENGEQILIGISSEITTSNCTGPKAVGVYVDVFRLIDWIRETTGISQ